MVEGSGAVLHETRSAFSARDREGKGVVLHWASSAKELKNLCEELVSDCLWPKQQRAGQLSNMPRASSKAAMEFLQQPVAGLAFCGWPANCQISNAAEC